LIKKDLSKKDKNDWKEFLDNLSSLPNKDDHNTESNKKDKKYKFDFHGYSIEEANKKVYEIVSTCFDKGISEILIVTGKGIHSSKPEKNVYVSEKFSKLRNTIPEFIKNNSDLNSKISQIKEANQDQGGSGALLIKLKKL
tara:strand:+ start:15474 stop:15893 length:420 start_codon:yes stop_codon:yes gene_type:complete